MFSAVVECFVLHPQSAMRHGQSLDQSGQYCHVTFLCKGSICQKLLYGSRAVFLTFLPLPSQFLSNSGLLRTEWECCKRWSLIVVSGRRNSGQYHHECNSMIMSATAFYTCSSLNVRKDLVHHGCCFPRLVGVAWARHSLAKGHSVSVKLTTIKDFAKQYPLKIGVLVCSGAPCGAKMCIEVTSDNHGSPMF